MYERLLENIKKGVWKSGDKLPSEPELSEQLSVSRASVRSALKLIKLCLLGSEQLFQLGLFLFILRTQQLEPFFLQLAHGIGFVQLFNQHVQFGAAPALFGNLAFQLLCRFLLAKL